MRVLTWRLVTHQPNLLKLFLHFDVVWQLLQMVFRDVVSHFVHIVDVVECLLGHFGVERVDGAATTPAPTMAVYADLRHLFIRIIVCSVGWRIVYLAFVWLLIFSMYDLSLLRFFWFLAALAQAFGLSYQDCLQVLFWPVMLISVCAFQDLLVVKLVVQGIEVAVVWTRWGRGRSILSADRLAAVYLLLASSTWFWCHSGVSGLRAGFSFSRGCFGRVQWFWRI